MKDFPPLKNDLLLRAARCQQVERVPVWAMRQAGRYLPEFKEVRAVNDFFTVCRTPQLACEVTLQPLRRMDLDAAIIFSDILVVPQSMGMEVQMVPGKGPVFPSPLKSPEDVTRLNCHPNVDQELGYVYEALSLTRLTLEGKVPLIGFSGAPWTLMAYMIEGGSSSTFSKGRSWLYRHPEESKRLLTTLSDIIITYLVGQVKSGAQLLQVFESHAGILGPEIFDEFSLPYLSKIATGVKNELKKQNIEPVPMTVFAKDAFYALGNLADTDYDVIGLDWKMDPALARQAVAGKNKALQGNLDPAALYASIEEIDKLTCSMVERFGVQGYIANLGHGMYPDMDPKHLKVFVDSVHSSSKRLAQKSS